MFRKDYKCKCIRNQKPKINYKSYIRNINMIAKIGGNSNKS